MLVLFQLSYVSNENVSINLELSWKFLKSNSQFFISITTRDRTRCPNVPELIYLVHHVLFKNFNNLAFCKLKPEKFSLPVQQCNENPLMH